MPEISPSNTVIVAIPDENIAARTVELLSSCGFSVVGPVDRAGAALALAAQTPVTLAVVGHGLTGRRDAPELARVLMGNWGAPSIMLDADGLAALHLPETDDSCPVAGRALEILAGPDPSRA